jgi:MOSC domain-containing protein YiiM
MIASVTRPAPGDELTVSAGARQAGSVAAVFVKPRKGEAVVPAASLECIGGLGIAGDANAAAGSLRQVLLVSAEAAAGLGLASGALWENITTTGLDVDRLEPGTHLRIGADVVVALTEACQPCRVIRRATGVPLRRLVGRRGVLGQVVAGGSVAPGDEVGVETGGGADG